MLCLKKKSNKGNSLQKCRKSQNRSNSVMKFEELNLMSNRLVEIADEFSGPDFPITQEIEGSDTQDLQVITKIFKISTQNHGYPRIVKVYEIKVNGKVIKITDMLTALPVELNDAYNEMVQSQSQEFPEELDYSIFFDQPNNGATGNLIGASGSKEDSNIIEESLEMEETIQKSVEENSGLISSEQKIHNTQGLGSQNVILGQEKISSKSLEKYENQEGPKEEKSKEKIKKQIFSISHKPIRKEKFVEKPKKENFVQKPTTNAFASHTEIHYNHVLESM